MNAQVDKGLCIACGMCPSIAPEVFQFGDDGLAEAISEVTQDNKSKVDEAIVSCPVDAISYKQ